MDKTQINAKMATAYQSGKRAMKRLFYTVLVLLLIVGLGAIFFRYYPYIFARHVHGVITNVEKPNSPMAVVGAGSDKATNTMTEKLVFAYAVAIQQDDGEIVTASTEDKQWAVAEKGKCVDAKFFPYPPWRFDKYGTYFGARLLKMYDCPQK